MQSGRAAGCWAFPIRCMFSSRCTVRCDQFNFSSIDKYKETQKSSLSTLITPPQLLHYYLLWGIAKKKSISLCVSGGLDERCGCSITQTCASPGACLSAPQVSSSSKPAAPYLPRWKRARVAGWTCSYSHQGTKFPATVLRTADGGGGRKALSVEAVITQIP